MSSVQPFYLEPKLPLEVTQDDVVELPVALVNGTPGALSHVTVKATVTFALPAYAMLPWVRGWIVERPTAELTRAR